MLGSVLICKHIAVLNSLQSHASKPHDAIGLNYAL
jgi:hypothetical protein